MRYTLVSLSDQTAPQASEDITHLIEHGRRRARGGWHLRTLRDSAAEAAVEQGCDLEHGGKEALYFGTGGTSMPTTMIAPPHQAFARAEAASPDWRFLDGPTRQALALAIYRLFGPDANTPVDLLLLHGGGRARPEAELRLIRAVCVREAIPIEFCPPPPQSMANWKVLAEVTARWAVGEVPIRATAR